jgi:hypothetical protein
MCGRAPHECSLGESWKEGPNPASSLRHVTQMEGVDATFSKTLDGVAYLERRTHFDFDILPEFCAERSAEV